MTNKTEPTNTTDYNNLFTSLNLTTTSSKIRYLLSEGKKRGEVAKILEIRYQHVRNVELQPLKKK